jgi:hypothetical protein
VRRLLSGAAFFIAFASAGLLAARLAEPGRLTLELDVYGLVVGALALFTAVFATREAFPRAGPSAIAEAFKHEPKQAERPPDLERTERLLTLATTTSFDLHYRLRPILREVAEQRLADRRGLRLDSGSPQVRQALGEDLWELVRPDRPAPDHRFEPGLPPDAVARSVEQLEAIE